MKTKSDVVHKWADWLHNPCLLRTKSELARKWAGGGGWGGGGCRTLHGPLHVRPSG